MAASFPQCIFKPFLLPSPSLPGESLILLLSLSLNIHLYFTTLEERNFLQELSLKPYILLGL